MLSDDLFSPMDFYFKKKQNQMKHQNPRYFLHDPLLQHKHMNIFF